MPLPPGRRLGPYELVSLIGAGGMGEVYRARDTRLGREVAVKIIASDGASNPDRLGRFEQEARAVAALDDPHILSIHDLGQEDGTTFAVFELLDGETLQQRLERGALTPRKAVEWAIQICRGLGAAHARGIVHRDLKPGNLFVTRDGRVKILDFGLAKLNETVLPGAEGENTPTRTATEKGMVLGTVGYMSPEQVRGRPADARSDLFAVGATLYEMLAGRPAFEGATPADKLSAILNREPPEIIGPGEAVPPPLGRVVHRCLEKDPEERFQSARDVAFALEALALGSRSGTELAPAALPRRRRWLKAAAVGAAVLAAAVLGLALGRTFWERPLPRIQQLTFRRGTVDRARFTSDGKTVVYSAYWDGKPPEIFTTRLESRESRSLGLPPARVLAVSSRGELAVLLTSPGDLNVGGTGTLARVSLSGGEPRRLLEDVAFADWSPDGRELAVKRRVDGAFQLEYPIGNTIIRPIGEGGGVRLSPGGNKLAITTGDDALAVYDRSGRKLATFPSLPPNESFAWDGEDALWVIAGEAQTAPSIWRVTLDGKAQEEYRSVGQLGMLHDASPDGRLLVHQGFERFGVRAKARGQEHERELGVLSWSGLGALSDDGRQVLLYEQGGGASQSFLRSMEGGPPVNLGEGIPLAISPSGRWAVLGTSPNLLSLTLVPTGAGETRRLATDGFERVRFATFIDEERVVVVANAKGEAPRSFLFDAGGGAPRPITPPGTMAIHGSFATDSFLGWSFIDRTIARFPLGGGEPRPLAGRRVLPGQYPIRASADGRSLFMNCGGVPLRIERLDLASGVRTPWKTLLPEEPAGVVTIEFALLTPDGLGYVYSYARYLQDLFVVGLRESSPFSQPWR